MALLKYGWKNSKDTSNDYCEYGTWKIYWENKSIWSKWPSKCQVEGCECSAEVGAHVCQPNAELYTYILPMCRKHNQEKGIFNIKKIDYLVEV